MKLKKILPALAQNIIKQGFDVNPKEIQSTSIPKIKSGADLLAISPEGSGKTTTIAIGIIQQLKEAVEEAPRAIVMVSDRDKAFELEEQFKSLAQGTNLRTFTVFEKGDIQYQKDMIYEGLDILIGTPTRINELLSVTGIPTSALKILAVDDAEMIFPNRYNTVVLRIAERTRKIQFLLFANRWHEKFYELADRILKSPIIIRNDE